MGASARICQRIFLNSTEIPGKIISELDAKELDEVEDAPRLI